MSTHIMSDVRHAYVHCYYNCHGNAAEHFSTLWDYDYRTVCVCYIVAILILSRDSWPCDLRY